MLVAAAPAWFANNVTPILLGGLVVLCLLVIWLVQKIARRAALIAIIVAIGLLVYLNRNALGTCAHTCACRVGGEDVTVPLCDPEARS